jgi:hypothetical protein
MTVENSELNTSGPLPGSNAGLTGGTGDGNRLLVADLARGYTDVGGQHMVLPSFWLQEGMSAVPDERSGFLTRPAGWER